MASFGLGFDHDVSSIFGFEETTMLVKSFLIWLVIFALCMVPELNEPMMDVAGAFGQSLTITAVALAIFWRRLKKDDSEEEPP